MNKKTIRHIQFYTSKAATYLEAPTPHRLRRLQAYQAELSRRLAASGYRWRPAISLGGEEV